jgi:hypothetical protein
MVVRKNIDKHDELGIVDEMFVEAVDARNVERDDAVFCVEQVLVAELAHLVADAGLDGILDERVEFFEISDRIIVERRSRPFFLVEHFTD